MCAAAMVHARVRRVVFGAFDPKAGAAGGMIDAFALKGLNHRVDVFGGVLEAGMRGAAVRVLSPASVRETSIGIIQASQSRMQLTQYTDFALRTLIALGRLARRAARRSARSAAPTGISRHHLVKVAGAAG